MHCGRWRTHCRTPARGAAALRPARPPSARNRRPRPTRRPRRASAPRAPPAPGPAPPPGASPRSQDWRSRPRPRSPPAFAGHSPPRSSHILRHGPECTLRRVTDDSLPELRASDADREHHAEVLRRAAGEGRLTLDELDERLSTVYESRTHRELERVVADVIVPGGHAHPATRGARMPVRRGEGGANWLVAIMSGRDRKGRWRVGSNLKVINFMGGSDLDLNDAELADDVVEMTVIAIMGGAEIRVPDGLNVELSEFAFMGGNNSNLGEERPDPGGPTLRLRMFSIMGGIDVKRGRKLTRAERKARKHLEHGG